ncbi:hypothetical protein [Xanthomonas sacchari]|uniref:hypothetical protein n=1 Tax=Xanthomonas sacchari TaxID=56458 RepID=UPI003526F113
MWPLNCTSVLALQFRLELTAFRCEISPKLIKVKDVSSKAAWYSAWVSRAVCRICSKLVVTTTAVGCALKWMHRLSQAWLAILGLEQPVAIDLGEMIQSV